MAKKGFTLMELLVSIFITGMVMLALVAMWKTSSNHTAQAQRQSVIKNENTIFLRTFYNDFVEASDVLCPNLNVQLCTNYKSSFFAIKNAILNPKETNSIIRLTNPVCGNEGDAWGLETNIADVENRCIKPSLVVYEFRNSGIYKCTKNFLDGDSQTITMADFATIVNSCLGENNTNLILPYVESFNMSVPVHGTGDDMVVYPEILLDYTVKKDFSGDVPPVYFKMKRYFVRKNGV